MQRRSSQGAALALAAKTAEGMKTATGQWGSCANVRRSPWQGAALAVAAKAHYVVYVHHVLVDPEEEIREGPPDLEAKTWEGPLEETQEMPLDHEEETRE